MSSRPLGVWTRNWSLSSGWFFFLTLVSMLSFWGRDLFKRLREEVYFNPKDTLFPRLREEEGFDADFPVFDPFFKTLIRDPESTGTDFAVFNSVRDSKDSGVDFPVLSCAFKPLDCRFNTACAFVFVGSVKGMWCRVYHQSARSICVSLNPIQQCRKRLPSLADHRFD